MAERIVRQRGVGKHVAVEAQSFEFLYQPTLGVMHRQNRDALLTTFFAPWAKLKIRGGFRAVAMSNIGQFS